MPNCFYPSLLNRIMPAFLEAYRAGLFTRNTWLPNIISGVIVGVVALPLAMAFAIASGAKPENGIYTAIIAGLLVSTLGGSRLQIAGPTGAFIVILSGITAKHGFSGLQIATLMAGIMLLIFGIAKMGAFIKFIPAPVIVGFTAGIAIIIWIGQWENFFGLPKITGEHFHEKLWHIIQALPQLHWLTTVIALLSLTLILYAPKKIPRLRRIPGPLIALVVMTVIQSVFRFDSVATIGTAFGGIPQGLPSFQVPVISAKQIVELIGPAFTIAILGAIESLLSAVVADGMTNTRHNSNQELIGQGIANIVTPLFGGFAATGAIARTATNIRNGGSSPLAGIVHSLTLVIVILFLAPLAVNIPLATLAAILFVVAWNMSEVRRFKSILQHAPKADIAILLVTFCLTVFADLVVAVNIGVILAMVQFLRRMAASVEVKKDLETECPPSIQIFTVEGPLFFGAAEHFEQALTQKSDIEPKIMILHLHWVPFVDITGIQAMEYVIEALQQRNIRILLAGANERVTRKLKKAGILALIGKNYHFAHMDEAVTAAHSLLEKHEETTAVKHEQTLDTIQ